MTLHPELSMHTPCRLALETALLPRLLSGGVAVLAVISMIAAGSVTWVLAILALVGLTGSLATERWEFDTDAGEVRRIVGVLGLSRITRIAIPDIDRLSVDSSHRGRSESSRMCRLVIVTSERPHVLDMNRGASPHLQEMGRRIADHLGVEFAIEPHGSD